MVRMTAQWEDALASADIDASKAEFLTALHEWSQQTTAALAALLQQP